ncbi:MAG TPA: hypothetical protein VK789_28375 [Bryobacteraceae bacterium]|jgi:hypothetical protein|nr:hypothetical protein [Bryobacteraceae bacterium]
MVHIVQCLCPQRHCIIALAYEAPTDADYNFVEISKDAMKALVDEAVKEGRLNPWCGICHSREWHYEDGVTRFSTVAEAQPELDRVHHENAIARRVLQGQRN